MAVFLLFLFCLQYAILSRDKRVCCGKRFDTQEKLRYHKRVCHQSCVQITGVERQVARDEDGNFRCPFDGCQTKLLLPQEIQRHYYRSHPAAKSPTVSPAVTDSDEPIKRTHEEGYLTRAKRARLESAASVADPGEERLVRSMRCIAISTISPSASQPPTRRLSISCPTSNYERPSTRSTTPEWDLQSDILDADDSTYGEEQQTSQSLGFYGDHDSGDSDSGDSDSGDSDSKFTPPPELKKARFVVTRRDKVAICEDCHYAVVASKIPGHILYTHKAPTALANEVRQAIEACGIRETTHPPKPLNRPLPFIEVKQGWRCTVTGCSFAALEKKTLKSHVCSTHPRKDGHATAASLMMPHPVQQVFHSPRHFWAVDLSGSHKISVTDDAHSMVLRLRDQERNTRANIITTPNNNRLVCPLLTLLGWDSLVDGQDGDLLQSLVSGGGGTEWTTVGDVNRAYFDQLRPIVRNFCVNSLFWIASPKLYDPASCPACMVALNYFNRNEKSNLPFHYLQTECSQQQYERMGEVIVCFALRVHIGHQSPFPILLSSTQQECIETLQDALSSAHSDEPECILAYHRVLASLSFAVHPEIDSNRTKEFWNALLMCTSLGGDESTFKSSHSIASTCSKLSHVLRLVAIKELKGKWDSFIPTGTTPMFE